MIERLLAADEALDHGDLERAERLFTQVADADARNAIALVGLARVAARRGDVEAARPLVARALEIDPDEAAAQRLRLELEGRTEREPAPVAPDEPRREPTHGLSLLDRIRRWLGLRGPYG